MDDFDRMIHNLNLLNEIELEALAEACQARAEGKRKARREGLRQDLMKNLQKAIDDVLHNGFNLTIENVDNPNWVIQLLPDEICDIEIE